eukprot:CAMPEP_0179932338 /NCGR_PEP_ID=MMETSP0983-20121128/11208_1 /TAXON_ID=483367 /ORGANISM="non described non described, Strain CCMP 2436" /LENGTH=84 /DNA_ID=CAMNT_0021836923 /DNA_START=408 /DNA_END=662 /DNA_ORIENTATION=+
MQVHATHLSRSSPRAGACDHVQPAAACKRVRARGRDRLLRLLPRRHAGRGPRHLALARGGARRRLQASVAAQSSGREQLTHALD